MNLQTPPKWRKGQTIFNFLWWLNQTKNFHREYTFGENGDLEEIGGRMADPFQISDKKMDELYEEFLREHAEG